MTHEHPAGTVDLLAVLGPVVGLVALAAYALAVVASRRRGRSWPLSRSLAWTAGCLTATAAVSGPLATASTMSWTAHMAGHLLLGMLGPLLLVLGGPVTLALRALPVTGARRLSRVLRSRPLRVLTEPSVAAVLDVGGLWLLYATPLLALAHAHPGVGLLVHAHVLLAGHLFSAVMVGRDPLPHRRGTRHLLVVLVLALAAHDVLAKRLYAYGYAPMSMADLPQGAQLMYYGGDAVDLLLAVLVCLRWYRAGGRSGQRQLHLERPRPGPQGVLG
ncbi:cytochrome c oxidase assembly protein [Microlunatus flavus]|uniref:Putative membrane protein n=1 Tax=Microlunatus flavus TaxID=1036181 RepID=A0A1H8Z6K8_9ACTN|nr:cytochrome c oxidase assembly protein [Microlunatus flavus]SEP60016.1 putative membrane protein [Microlunatus flavus]